jgi:O-antigen/teichoic acid export membrane protein
LGVLPGFSYFIKLYSFNYLSIALILLLYLTLSGKINFTFSISRVTKKFYKKIATLALFVFGGSVISTVSAVIGTVIIASVVKNGLALAGVFTLAQFMSSIVQAPQRGIISSSVPVLSQAWKDKDMDKIQRIYHRSSINQLIFATVIFGLIWLNFDDGISSFGLQKNYALGKYAFFFLGLMRIIDMGTGLNGQIIGTSNQWRFEFFTGIILILLALPLNYFLTKETGIMGPPVADLIAFAVWNLIRYYFLYSKYQLQPFNSKTLLTILFTILNYYICYFIFNGHHGILWMAVRSLLFLLLSISSILYFRLTPDVLPVWNTLLKKTGLRKVVN